MTTLMVALALVLGAATTPASPDVETAPRDAGTTSSPHDAAIGDDAGAHEARDVHDGADGAAPEVARKAATAPPAPRTEPPSTKPAPVAPHTASIRGQVVEKGGRRPLAGATVTVDGAIQIDTDAEGRFAVDLPSGRHHVQIQQPGFDISDAIVDVARGAPAIVVRLVPQAVGDRYETVVRSKRAEGAAISFDKDELARIPGTLGDPFRAIETLPGVASIAWPLPVYAVRGANPGNTGFFLDGLRVPALFHFALGPAVIHPAFIDAMDFYPGGYPARYGRYVAGAVTASTRAPPSDLAHGEADVRLFDAGVLASSPFDRGRGTIEIAGRYSYTAALFSLLSSGVNLSYSDAQLRADHPLGPGRLTLLAFGSTDALTSKNPQNLTDRLAIKFARADLRFTAGVGPGRLIVGLGAGADRSMAPFHSNGLTVNSRSLLPHASFQVPVGRSVDVEIGSDAELQTYATTLRDADPALSDLARDRSATMAAAYAMTSLRFGSRLILTPAFRGDVYAQEKVTRFSHGPRLTARLQVGDDVWLKAIGGHYSQMPSLPLEVAGFEGFGLAQHGLQTSWQGSTGVEAPIGAGLSIDGSVYVQRYVLTDIRDPNSGDYLLNDYLVRRDALSYGLEVLVRRPISSRLSGWIGYTLSRNLRAFEGGSIGPSDWDQRHILNLVLGYRMGRYTFGGRAHLHTGRPIRVDDTNPIAYERPPAFYQVDLRAERRILTDRFTFTFYVELVNATFTRQVTSLMRDPNGTIEEGGFRIVVPSIGLRAEI